MNNYAVTHNTEFCQQKNRFTLKCGTRLSLSDLERAGVSYVPCGQVDGQDTPLLKYAHLWGNRKQVTLDSYGKNANSWTLSDMTGAQIMTGYPTFKPSADSPSGYLHLTDIDIERHLFETHPEIVNRIMRVYRESCEGTPCVIQTKSDGRRLSAFSAYLDNKREFKDPSDKMLLEIFSIKGLSRLDHRYGMIEGSILDLPTLPKEAIQEIHGIISEVATEKVREPKDRAVVESSQIGDLAIDWNDKGKSQYFPAAHCQATSHKNSERDTVQFSKVSDGIEGHCFNCGESWWEIEPKKTIEKTKQQASRNFDDIRGINPITTLPLDHPILNSAPPIEARETPSFRHFSPEERNIVSDVLSLDPDAGWHGQTPVFTTRYEYLHPLTQKFALNGQPSDVEKRRVWNTMFGKCDICGAVTAQWIDRYLLTAGVYCDGCHKDYHLGSYLEIELNRKLPNSIVSEYQGFLGDDPEFSDFRLWEPGMLTHLGAGMSTGKSTEIYTALIVLAQQGLGKGIIAVPRVSLARFLAHYLRRKYGYRSWGLWHEGCHKSDKFIGDFGAIVCLPSLRRAVATAEEDGVSQLYIAIDEVDFGYNLLSLSVEQATAVKKCLRDALASTGLVVSGQTESTLALEGLAKELGCEQIQGFYNTAKPADGRVVMKKHANIDGKSMDILCGGIDDTSELLDEGYNVYTFCSTRRDGDVLADEFKNENPVVYNAYTKGDPRADAVLKNQRLTDSRLFIGTSAAGVGISILDPNARTVILNGLNYGSRDASMSVQECVRDRWRCGIFYHYADYDLSLPVRPSENEKVSIYHEALKAAASRYADLPTAGIRKIAHSQALASLADTQIETFIEYHLGIVGNMPVYHESALESEPDRITSISTSRAVIRSEERENRITTAIEMLNVPDLLTTSEIRVLSNQGSLSPDERLAHETANAAAQAVGWDDEIHGYDNGIPIKILPNPDALKIAIELTEQNIDTDNLSKQRRGYLAVNFPQWTAHQFQAELERSDSGLVTDGLGIEITAIGDDRFIGELLSALLERLIGTVLDSASLAEAVRKVLASEASTGKTFGTEIAAGALGASVYRKARFLDIADDDRVIDWVRGFISEWYPARIAKNEDTYALCHAKHLDLRLAAFSRWLLHQPSVPDGTQIDLDIFQPTALPDPNAELKKVARFRREGGETIKSIAESLNRNPKTIRKWCKGIKPPSPAQSEVLSILNDGKVWKKSEIEELSRFAGQNVRTALRKLLDAGKISKLKRGMYQKKTS